MELRQRLSVAEASAEEMRLELHDATVTRERLEEEYRRIKAESDELTKSATQLSEACGKAGLASAMAASQTAATMSNLEELKVQKDTLEHQFCDLSSDMERMRLPHVAHIMQMMVAEAAAVKDQVWAQRAEAQRHVESLLAANWAMAQELNRLQPGHPAAVACQLRAVNGSSTSPTSREGVVEGLEAKRKSLNEEIEQLKELQRCAHDLGIAITQHSYRGSDSSPSVSRDSSYGWPDTYQECLGPLLRSLVSLTPPKKATAAARLQARLLTALVGAQG